MATPPKQVTGWVGWVYFAGIILIVRAFFEALLGIVSLTQNDFYVVTQNHLAVFNYTAWGWGQIILAMIMLFAGFSVLSGHMFGRVVAIIVTGLSLLGSLAFLPAYPVWSIAAIALEVVILYALLVHGGEAAE
jgi:hypothetical protein